jgi:hypothetical protein
MDMVDTAVRDEIEQKEIKTGRIRVYIASPYTKGDCALNVKAQIDAADQLMSVGFVPFAPLFSHFQHMIHPRPYSDWIELDMQWLKKCDCVLRLAGESSGADKEVDWAMNNNLPVFYSMTDLCKHYRNRGQ